MNTEEYLYGKMELLIPKYEAMQATLQAVLDWNDRTDGFCEREDIRDVLEPVRAALAGSLNLQGFLPEGRP